MPSSCPACGFTNVINKLRLARNGAGQWAAGNIKQAFRLGLIGLEAACLRYGLTVEEFRSWQRAIEQHGIYGLRVTRLQIYRDTDGASSAKGSARPERV